MEKEITRSDVVELIASTGKVITTIVQGHIGSGKSAIIHDLASKFKDTHKAVYIDMTMLDIGDLRLPAVDHKQKTSTFYPNESFGLHFDGPMIIMLDELGKASPSVKNAVLPILIERRLDNIKFHPDTIVFATTNLGAENVGDMFKPHERNRMTFVQMAKPDVKEWTKWAVNHEIQPEVIAWANRNRTVFDSFEDVEDPSLNPYIYHPREPRAAFVTHRSLEQASHLVARRQEITPQALTHALIGTIGGTAAMELISFIELGAGLPSFDLIFKDPERAPIPNSPAALIMLCTQSVSWVDADTLSAWMTYMNRFPSKEHQAFWAVLIAGSNKLEELASQDLFADWAIDNNYLFA